MASSSITEKERYVRKLRKKIRQIECLEAQRRELNAEEAIKVRNKARLRNELRELLACAEDMKRRSSGNAESLENVLNEASVSLEDPTERRLKRPRPDAESANAAHPASNEEDQPGISATASSDNDERSDDAESPEWHRRNALFWRSQSLTVRQLKGHEDDVVASDLDAPRHVFVTASRDTTVIAWRLDRPEHSSLRGHTSAVTAVRILPAAANQFFGLDEDAAVLAISGSLDCSIKLWNLSAAAMVKSIYTFNGILCLSYHADTNCAYTGSDGGKLEAFSLSRGKSVHSVTAHEDAITAMDLRETSICSASRDGTIKIWRIEGGLKCLFVTESDSGLRNISSVCFVNGCDLVACGDSGCNIKLVDWRQNAIAKLPNHQSDVGFTDCLRAFDSCLMATSFDVDSGQGHVNMFLLRGNSTPSYLCSWSHENTSRIFNLSFALADEGHLTLLTCGKQLKLWQSDRPPSSSEEDQVFAKLLCFSNNALDSGSSDSDSDNSEDQNQQHVEEHESEPSNRERCSIL